jgi:hypothetical protein
MLRAASITQAEWRGSLGRFAVAGQMAATRDMRACLVVTLAHPFGMECSKPWDREARNSERFESFIFVLKQNHWAHKYRAPGDPTVTELGQFDDDHLFKWTLALIDVSLLIVTAIIRPRLRTPMAALTDRVPGE